MTALRRVLSMLMLSTLLGVGGAVGGMVATASAAAISPHAVVAPHDSAPNPKPPSSTVPGTQVRGEKFTKYCVHNYKPNSTVKVVNPKTGAVRYIHTDSHGNGCVMIPVDPGCQTIRATGINAAGDRAHSSATVCVLGKRINRPALPFTGSNIIIPGTIIGLVLIVVGTAATILVRRRRSSTLA